MLDDDVHNRRMINKHPLTRLPQPAPLALPILIRRRRVVAIRRPFSFILPLLPFFLRNRLIFALCRRLHGLPGCTPLERTRLPSLTINLGLLFLDFGDALDLPQKLGEDVFCREPDVDIAICEIFAVVSASDPSLTAKLRLTVVHPRSPATRRPAPDPVWNPAP